MFKATILGGGSWATAIVKILSEQDCDLKWWIRNPKAAQYLQIHKHNPSYLSSVEINTTKVKVSSNIHECLEQTEWVIVAIPAAFIPAALDSLRTRNFDNKYIISAVKGTVSKENLLVTDFMKSTFQIPLENQGVIAGPCHAEEIAQEKFSYLTIASPNATLANKFSDAMDCRFVRCSTSDDLYGVEYAAVMKNIVAIASGITHGMGCGDNFHAVLVANAMQEIERFVQRIDPRNERIMTGSAYLGDLLVTTYSQHSRNRLFGTMVGRGYSVKNAQMEMNMVAEGYFAAKSIFELVNALELNMPITNFVHAILYRGIEPKVAFENLRKNLY